MVRARVPAEPLCAVTWRSLLNSVRNTATAMLSIRCVRNSNNAICFPEDDLSFAKITETKNFRNLSADDSYRNRYHWQRLFRLLLDDHDVSLGNRNVFQQRLVPGPPHKPPEGGCPLRKERHWPRRRLRLSFSAENQPTCTYPGSWGARVACEANQVLRPRA